MVLSGVLVLIALPAAISAWPASQSGVPAEVLLARILASDAAGYSGYAESSGGLALPVTRQLSTVGDLFGGTTRMRVWWRNPRTWRVDTIDLAGETDVHAWPRGIWTWNYESNRATWSGPVTDPAIRLPVAGDLLPTNLAIRLLSEAGRDEVSRVPSKRIAGRSAPGLRLRPAAPESTIDHVDVWADSATGLPLRVDMIGKGSSATVLSTRFIDFSTRTPPERDVDFQPPPGADVRITNDPDLAGTIDQVAGRTPPDRLAGLIRNPDLPQLGAIGVYGFGVTELAAVPLPDRLWFGLQDQLKNVAQHTPDGLVMSVGPLTLLLSNFVDEHNWLLTGTVTQDTLTKAAAELLRSGVR